MQLISMINWQRTYYGLSRIELRIIRSLPLLNWIEFFELNSFSVIEHNFFQN